MQNNNSKSGAFIGRVGGAGIRIVPPAGPNSRSGIKLYPDSATVYGEIHTRGEISVGGSLVNTVTGKIKVFDNGTLQVQKDLINSGDISISDPEKIKQIIIEALKATGSTAEFGLELLKKLNLFK